MELRDGDFRVSACEHGHVSLEVVDDDGLTVFLTVMERGEAAALALKLMQAAELW